MVRSRLRVIKQEQPSLIFLAIIREKEFFEIKNFIFLQQAHSSPNDEQNWKDNSKDPLFFFTRKNNSCGVAFGYCEAESCKVVNTSCDKNERILIFDAELNDTDFLLINLYNSSSESEQLSTLSTLTKTT